MFFPIPLRSATSWLLVLAICSGSAGTFQTLAEETPPPPPADPPGSGRISGKVYGAGKDDPVRGAVVRVHYLPDGREVAAEPSDGKGRFEIEGLDHGYLEITVERDGARFAGSDVIALPPKGSIAVDLTLTRLEERSASWWESRAPLQLPGGEGEAVGLAEVRPEVRGRDFWKSKKGIALIAAVGGAALLAIVAGSRNSPSSGP